MTLEEAEKILKDSDAEFSFLDTALVANARYFSWGFDEDMACLDSRFTADELEAIAVYIRAKTEQKGE